MHKTNNFEEKLKLINFNRKFSFETLFRERFFKKFEQMDSR